MRNYLEYQQIKSSGIQVWWVIIIREEEVQNTVRKMKNKKALRPDEVPVVVWKVLRRLDKEWLNQFYNKVLVQRKILQTQRKSYVVQIFKGK